LLDFVVSFDGPLGWCMPLEVMRRLAGDCARDTQRWRILHRGIGRILEDAPA
jgi:hypothetical protein